MTTYGMTFTRRVTHKTRGKRIGNRISVAIGFDPEQFEAVRDAAEKTGISFAEQVRRMLNGVLAGKKHP